MCDEMMQFDVQFAFTIFNHIEHSHLSPTGNIV